MAYGSWLLAKSNYQFPLLPFAKLRRKCIFAYKFKLK